ncbi:hypothetical protein [Acidovorax sp. FG27]|uniref:hypothetical protein n=1 Tax=Acidovorax sp. FG27 TaxID=3133652 RepID=UPI003342221F
MQGDKRKSEGVGRCRSIDPLAAGSSTGLAVVAGAPHGPPVYRAGTASGPLRAAGALARCEARTVPMRVIPINDQFCFVEQSNQLVRQ